MQGAVQAPITLKLAYKMVTDYYEHQTEHAARAGAGAQAVSAFPTKGGSGMDSRTHPVIISQCPPLRDEAGVAPAAS